MLSTPFFQPVLEQPSGWSGLRESRPLRQQVVPVTRPDCFDEEPYDDTFKIFKARESVVYPNTNDHASSRNYPRDLVSVVNGEHLTLLSTGELHEALDEDDDTAHILQHRQKLGDPQLTSPQRQGLHRHLLSHIKNRKRKSREVQESSERFNYAGNSPRHSQFQLRGNPQAKHAVHSAVIPQDDPQTEERKKTSGQMSAQAFESFGQRQESFGRALQTARRSY